jgi:hypothetical protein
MLVPRINRTARVPPQASCSSTLDCLLAGCYTLANQHLHRALLLVPVEASSPDHLVPSAHLPAPWTTDAAVGIPDAHHIAYLRARRAVSSVPAASASVRSSSRGMRATSPNPVVASPYSVALLTRQHHGALNVMVTRHSSLLILHMERCTHHSRPSRENPQQAINC